MEASQRILFSSQEGSTVSQKPRPHSAWALFVSLCPRPATVCVCRTGCVGPGFVSVLGPGAGGCCLWSSSPLLPSRGAGLRLISSALSCTCVSGVATPRVCPEFRSQGACWEEGAGEVPGSAGRAGVWHVCCVHERSCCPVRGSVSSGFS